MPRTYESCSTADAIPRFSVITTNTATAAAINQSTTATTATTAAGDVVTES